MSKFGILLALVLVTAYSAYCVIMYPTNDVHFVEAAYLAVIVATATVSVEMIRLIVRSIYDGLEWMRERRLARQARKRQAAEPLPTEPTVRAPVEPTDSIPIR